MKAGKTSCQVDQPKPEMERPTVWGEPTEVQVAIYIIGQQMAWRSVPESVEIRPEGTVISDKRSGVGFSQPLIYLSARTPKLFPLCDMQAHQSSHHAPS